MSGYQNYYTDGQSNKSTVNSSAYGDTNQSNYYNNYYGGYEGYQGYEGYDASQYYDPNGYYGGGGGEYYQYNDGSGYAQDGSANPVARYSHSFATSTDDGSTGVAGSAIPTASGAAATAGSATNNNKKAMDGMTSAQRKKLAYYQYFGEEIPEHTTSGYTREDDQGLIKPTGLASATAAIPAIPTPPPPSMATPTIAAAPTVGSQGGGGKMTHKKKNHEKGNHKKNITLRYAAGETWEDQSLADWDDNDYRLFAGDLGNEVTDETLFKAFAKYPTCQKARVVRDKRSGKTRGYGFISFGDANDFVKAWREMNGNTIFPNI